MYTILAIILFSVGIGFIFRNKLRQKIPNAGCGDFKTYMGHYIAISIMVGLVAMIALMVISISCAFKHKSKEYDCKLIMVNNSFLTITADRYGDVRYAYVFTDGKNIKTGTTKIFTIIPESSEPIIHFTEYATRAGSWLLPLSRSDSIESEICIPQSLLNNVSRNVEQTNDKGGK